MTVGEDFYNLVITGDDAGAIELADDEANWPLILHQAMVTLVNSNRQEYQTTSGTSLSVSTGSKVVTTAISTGWIAGTPVLIADAAAPTTNYMVGQLASDASGTSITVTVSATTGSGTFTSWNVIRTGSHALTGVSIPVSLTDGAFGANLSTFAGRSTGHRNVELQRSVAVEEMVAAPPGSPVSGDYYLVIGTATGGFAGQEDDFAYWNGSTWDFFTPDEGDQCYDKDTNRGSTYIGQATYKGPWFGSFWEYDQDKARTVDSIAVDTALSVEDIDGKLYIVSAVSGDVTITLPAASDSGALAAQTWFRRTPGDTNTVTFNVSGGGDVEGATTYVMAPGERFRIAADLFPGREGWWTF